MSIKIPFNALRPTDDAARVDAAIRRVVESGWFVLGPEVEAFEREFAAACGTSHAVSVGTGTDAIALIFRGLGIGAGDEVITSPLSAAYSALAIMMAGARPVFVDLDPDRLTIDPARIASAITPRTKAILPVHLYGQAADLDAIHSWRRATISPWSKTPARRISPPTRVCRSAADRRRRRGASIPRRTSARSATAAPSPPTILRWPSASAGSATAARSRGTTTRNAA
jgi:hypothetical protein